MEIRGGRDKDRLRILDLLMRSYEEEIMLPSNKSGMHAQLKVLI